MKLDLGTVLITGAAGYVGSQLAWTLSDLGVPSIGVDMHSWKGRWPARSSQYTQYVDNLYPGLEFDWVVHLAAFTSAPESIKQPLAYWDNNVGGLREVINIAHKAKAKGIVFMSSSAVYDPLRRQSWVLPEDHLINPLTPYGSTKVAGEQLVRISGLPYVNLRLFNVAGADRKLRAGLSRQNGSLFKTVCRAALTDQVFTIYDHGLDAGDGSPERDFVHVEDVSEAICRTLDYLSKERPSCTLNVGTGVSTTVREVVREVERQLGKQVSKIMKRPREGDVAFSRASIDRLQGTLGWAPLDDLSRMVRDSLAWEKQQLTMEGYYAPQ